MKRLVVATLLSSLLAAGVSVAGYFVFREMQLDLANPIFFWSTALLGSSFLLVLTLLPAAVAPPTVLQSMICVALAMCLGTVTAVTFVVLWIWGLEAQPRDGGPEILNQLRHQLLPAATALAVGAAWRRWVSPRRQRASAGV
jgi:hypothetical protein